MFNGWHFIPFQVLFYSMSLVNQVKVRNVLRFTLFWFWEFLLGNWTIEMNILLYWAKLYSWMCAMSQFDHSCLCCSWEKWCEWSWELVEWCAGCHGRWHCAYHCHRNHHGHYVSHDMTLRHTRITLPCIKIIRIADKTCNRIPFKS